VSVETDANDRHIQKNFNTLVNSRRIQSSLRYILQEKRCTKRAI